MDQADDLEALPDQTAGLSCHPAPTGRNLGGSKLMDQSGQTRDEVALLWWIRVMVNLAFKLYGPSKLGLFFRDYQLYVKNIRGFRGALRGRGWAVPDAEQERLIGLLVVRCQKYLTAQGEHSFIPGYFWKSLRRYVDELADDLNYRFKRMPGRELMSADARSKLDAVLLESALHELRDKWKEEDPA